MLAGPFWSAINLIIKRVKFIIGVGTPPNHRVRSGPARLLEYPEVSRKELGISRPSYYKVKERFVAEGNKALNPHSRAPKTDRRIYSDQTKTTVLRIRKRLAKDGWDNGPLSIWFESLDTRSSVSYAPRWPRSAGSLPRPELPSETRANVPVNHGCASPVRIRWKCGRSTDWNIDCSTRTRPRR